MAGIASSTNSAVQSSAYARIRSPRYSLRCQSQGASGLRAALRSRRATRPATKAGRDACAQAPKLPHRLKLGLDVAQHLLGGTFHIPLFVRPTHAPACGRHRQRSGVERGADLDTPRRGFRPLRDDDLKHPVVTRCGDAVGVGAVGQREAAMTALDARETSGFGDGFFEVRIS